jgi:predicted pyridoxine 5'-phosphate oxidase superfamily flavin-nucleotide-binding protein
MGSKFFDLMFTESVRLAQSEYGSRKHYARFEGGEAEFEGLDENEKDFIGRRDSFYLSTVGETGHPYIQFRGGPRGFLKILDDKTLGYADFRGNLQYISVGNLKANDKAALILMDYPNKARLKVLARIEVIGAKEAPELIEKLTDPNYQAKIERAMILHIEAVDWNCPQHIPQRFTLEEIEQINAPIYEHIEKLEKEITKLNKDKSR